jgi:UDP-glucose 4-epimerase
LQKKYLVLGGCGFIGRHLVNRLSEIGSVRVFDRDKIEFPNKKNVEVISGEFSSVCFDKLISGIDTIYHLISTTIPSDDTSYSVLDMEQNVIPTIKLLEAMVNSTTKKIIFLSSGGTIYGKIDRPAAEETPTNPLCSYAIQKQTIEQYLSLYHEYHGITAIRARLSNPYGTGQQEKRRQGVIPIFTRAIKEGKTIDIWGDGNTVRDYIHIEDAVEALTKLDEYSGPYDIFNIGSGKGHSLLEIIQIICKELNVLPKINYLPGRKCDVPYSVLDVNRIRTELDWCAKIELEQGIKLLL